MLIVYLRPVLSLRFGSFVWWFLRSFLPSILVRSFLPAFPASCCIAICIGSSTDNPEAQPQNPEALSPYSNTTHRSISFQHPIKPCKNPTKPLAPIMTPYITTHEMNKTVRPHHSKALQHPPKQTCCSPSSYHNNKETILFIIDPQYGNLN